MMWWFTGGGGGGEGGEGGGSDWLHVKGEGGRGGGGVSLDMFTGKGCKVWGERGGRGVGRC